ncbi:short coiled-coil protein isoform X2 [Alexandromys fortis]|uniref:short coiled-coil protein isoform X2 n=1 Tax=Alexandromys fortis TaxID=100897 RepID=UPI002151FF9C|nr:short coiled-coil protein isoform X2 [Microtus fortis]
MGRKGGAAAVSWSESRGLRRPAHPAPFPAPQTQDHSSNRVHSRAASLLPKMMNADMDDLSARVDAVKEENLKLKSENQVLGQYIENLMSASSVFQTTDTKSKRK